MGLFGLNTNFLSSIVCKLQVHDNRLNVKTSILIRRLSYSDRRDKLVPNKVENPHSILIKKLKYYGLNDASIKWFESYLSNRKQYVEIDNIKSELKSVNIGVPQGSILGPLLFIIYVKDINKASKCFESILYADDTS